MSDPQALRVVSIGKQKVDTLEHCSLGRLTGKFYEFALINVLFLHVIIALGIRDHRGHWCWEAWIATVKALALKSDKLG